MKAKTKISVITVVLNGELQIEKAIKSVVEQTHDNVEYIIIDGGSTDSTISIINRYKNSISTFISENDHGIYDAMNKGARLATGELLYFLGYDDYLFDKQVLSKIATEYLQRPMDLIYGNVVFYNSFHHRHEVSRKNISLFKMRFGLRPPHQGAFMRRKVLFENNLFDLNYKICSDFDLFLKVIKNKKYTFNYINLSIASYGVTGQSSNNENVLVRESGDIIKRQLGLISYFLYRSFTILMKCCKLLARKSHLIKIYYRIIGV